MPELAELVLVMSQVHLYGQMCLVLYSHLPVDEV